MAGGMGGAAGIPPDQVAMLAAALGGAGGGLGGPSAGMNAPAGPPIASPVLGPAGAAPMLGDHPDVPPMPDTLGAGAIPGMPSTDPQAILDAASQLAQQDMAALAMAQHNAMATAAAGMGGAIVPPAPGMRAPGTPMMPGAAAAPMLMDQPLPMPGSTAGAWGGPSAGGMEGGALAPGAAFADQMAGAGSGPPNGPSGRMGAY